MNSELGESLPFRSHLKGESICTSIPEAYSVKKKKKKKAHKLEVVP